MFIAPLLAGAIVRSADGSVKHKRFTEKYCSRARQRPALDVQQAPAALLGQVVDLQLEQIDVVGTGGEARQQLVALGDVQADLDAGVARAERGDQAGGDGARLRLGGEAQGL